MHDVDGHFCDGNGKLLPRTGEEYAAQLEREREKSTPMTTEEERKAAHLAIAQLVGPSGSLCYTDAIDLQCARARIEKRLEVAEGLLQRAAPLVECVEGCQCDGDILFQEIRAFQSTSRGGVAR